VHLQFVDREVEVNVSDGLLHLLNDIGYPHQGGPEALPCLRLCHDLAQAPGADGFFYSNDIKVMEGHDSLSLITGV
jgi:hypothetical protein